MIVVEIDGQNAKLVKGKWGGNEVLAPTLEAIGEEYPFKGGGFFPTHERCALTGPSKRGGFVRARN